MAPAPKNRDSFSNVLNIAFISCEWLNKYWATISAMLSVCSKEVQARAGCCSERRPVIISPEIAFIDIYCMI